MKQRYFNHSDLLGAKKFKLNQSSPKERGRAKCEVKSLPANQRRRLFASIIIKTLMRAIPFKGGFFLLFLLAIASCKKEAQKPGPGTSALTIVNGGVGDTILTPNFSGTSPINPSFYQLNMLYGNFYFFSSYSGQQKLGLYQVPATYPDTTISSKPVYNLTLSLPLNTIHTLFLMGTPQNPDQLFTTDHLPYHTPADSAMGIRFVNISQGSALVSVDIMGQANGSETQNLSYKGVTAFKNYPANSTISSYTFEFRDQASGTLLGSCTLSGINTSSGITPNTWLNQNFTLALLGAPGGLATNGVLIINEDVQQ